MNINQKGGTIKDDKSKGGKDKSMAKRVRPKGLGPPMELPDLLQ